MNHSGRVPWLRNKAMRLLLWACAYLAIAAALLGANPFRGETVGPFDLLAAHAGWRVDDAPVAVRHMERSDILDALVPEWMEARRQIRSGDIPLWNPLRAGGGAALLDPTNALLTPGFAAFAAAPDPPSGFYLSTLLTLVIAGLGMHLLVARECGPWAALFAGISYMACGFLAAWLYWPHAHTAIWIPWLLLAVGAFTRTGSLRAFAGIAVASAMLLLGGFPFVIAVGYGAALVHAAVGVAPLEHRKLAVRLAAVCAGIGLGLALVAVPLSTMLSEFSALDLSGRPGGSSLNLEAHRKLLLMPWAGREPRVESSMYVGMAAMALMVVGLATLFRRHRNPLAVSGALFVLVGIWLVFGIVPLEIGRRLPVLSGNLWSRAIVLLDMGVILLAAVGFDRLLAHARWRAVAMLVAILVCALQAFDLGRQFRRFNGETPARYFYPVSAELARLKREVKPFQYVAQDSGYFVVSGTLGAIGLGEWYAHSLRTPALRNLLDAMAAQPFSTPTATAINISEFHWSNELTDAAGLCYAVFPTATGVRELVAQSAKGKKNVALPPINDIDLVQPFKVTADSRVAAMQVRLATYRAVDVDGTVILTLRRTDNGAEIARSSLPAASIQDNRMARFPFAGTPELPAGDYEAIIRYAPGARKRNLTAWLQADAPGQVRHGPRTVAGSLQFAVFGSTDHALEVVARGNGVTVARNTDCVDGAYWTADLTEPLSSREQGSVRLGAYSPHRFEMTSSSTAAGFVIVPMQYQRGWTAHVDGRPARIRLVGGVMPAVAVPAGRSRIAFAYDPPHWRRGLAISFSAVLLLAGAWGFRRNRRRGSFRDQAISSTPTNDRNT